MACFVVLSIMAVVFAVAYFALDMKGAMTGLIFGVVGGFLVKPETKEFERMLERLREHNRRR